MFKKDEIAYLLLLRLTLGANIFLHGFSRLISPKFQMSSDSILLIR